MKDRTKAGWKMEGASAGPGGVNVEVGGRRGRYMCVSVTACVGICTGMLSM